MNLNRLLPFTNSLYFYILLLSFLPACSDHPVVSPEQKHQDAVVVRKLPVKPLVIDNGEEEGWGADIRLSMTQMTENDTANIYTAIASYESKNLGLTVIVPKPPRKWNGFGSGFIIKSIGEESDYLIKVLRKLYHLKKDSTARFTNQLTLNYVNLDQFAKDRFGKGSEPHTVAHAYKLFFESENGEEYAELYLNVDALEKWVEIREKDEEYRSDIIKFLTRK